MSHICPVCRTTTSYQHPDSPYWCCPSCDLWFQDPLPPKRFQADNEGDENGDAVGHLMGDTEKAINQHLAESLVGYSNAKKMLDIGSKYPYLAHCFRNLGCDSYGMDGIKEVPMYSQELQVPMILGNFEELSVNSIQDQTKEAQFDLVTMIHVFEHMYHPLDALKKLHQLIRPNGVLHLRLPDHGVSGFEQHLSPNHYAIHPYFWSLPALMELLVQGQDLFVIEKTEPMADGGQRDVTLRSICKKPTIWCGMIVKNEERDLPICLESIQDVVDGLVVIDTGSTDQTVTIAQQFPKPTVVNTYLEASAQDETGDWKLWDFSKARNQFVDTIDAIPEADLLLWMDADDKLLTPANLKRMAYLQAYDIFGMQIQTGGVQWTHHRMWRTRKGVRFYGRIHEYPDLANLEGINIQDCIIEHNAAPNTTGENSNQRNLRILEAEFAENPDSRTAFYLANTHKDGGRWDEAIHYYDYRIKLGEFYKDEWLFAYLYKARCERAANHLTEAEHTLLEALSHAPDWAEFWMELSYMAYDKSEWHKALGYAIEAGCRNISATSLWREPNMYMDQPRRMCSFCEEFLGHISESLQWALSVRKVLANRDDEWEARISNLQAMQAEVSQGVKHKQIALLRPGALGDILMTLNLVPLLQKKYPGYRIDYFCHPTCKAALGDIMQKAGICRVRDIGMLEQVAPFYEKIINLVGYPLQEGYPNTPMSKHLIQYFGDEMGLTIDQLPTLTLPKPRLDPKWQLDKPYATIQSVAGWSVYKTWPLERWGGLVAACPEIRWIQIGGENDPKIPGADHSFMGKEIDATITLVANATIHVGVDSFPNHLTNYSWKSKGHKARKTPAVILWGSTHHIGSGYEHNVNIGLNLPCRPCYKEDPAISAMSQGPCNNPPDQTYDCPKHACLVGLPLLPVVRAVKDLWNQETTSDHSLNKTSKN